MKSAATPPALVAYAFGPFSLDLQHHLLQRGNETIALTSKAYETLVLLLTHRDRVVEKDELIGAVWPDAHVSDDSLTQAISALRKALGDDSSQPVYIATVPRRGYRFTAPAREIPAPASVEDQRSSAVPPEVTRPNPGVGASASARRRWPLVSIVSAGAVVALIFIARTALVAPRGVPTGAPIRFVQAMPTGTLLASSGELSPDGRYLTFAAQDTSTGIVHLWVRPLDVPVARMLTGTEGAYRPFWSPDSQSIGFFADGKLKRIGVAGTPPRTVAAVGYRPSGGSWSAGGVIIYADRLSQLFAVPDTGGEATSVTALDPALSESGHHGAQFLPDGDHFLFSTTSSVPEKAGTYIGSLSSKERVHLLDATSQQAIYVAPGYLLYAKDKVLLAQRLDTTALRLSGAPVVVPTINGALEEGGMRVGSISASANGLLTFGGDLPPNHLTWLDRTGRELETIPAPTSLHNPMISPDGQSLVADGAGNGIWLVDLERSSPTRLVPEGNLASWSTDGTRVVFTTRRAGAPAIFQRSVTGHDEESPLVRPGEMKIAGNWSPDGKRFVYASSNTTTRLDLWTVTMGANEPQEFLRSPANELQPQISPDGRWIAYSSDESGAWEVYVQSFPIPGRKRAISLGGGAQPQWRRDGRELFYISPEGTLMAVPLRSGADLTADKPKPLFRVATSADIISYRNQYAVAPSGDRFIVDVDAERDPLHVLVNWTALVNP